MTELLAEIAALAITGIYIVGGLSARMGAVETRLKAVERAVKDAS